MANCWFTKGVFKFWPHLAGESPNGNMGTGSNRLPKGLADGHNGTVDEDGRHLVIDGADHGVPSGKRLQFANWKITIFKFGKSTIPKDPFQ